MKKTFHLIALAVGLALMAPASIQGQIMPAGYSCPSPSACVPCGLDVHEAWSFIGGGSSGVHEDCIGPTYTCSGHPACGADASEVMERVDELLKQSLRGDVLALIELVDEYDNAVLNLDRRAIQLYSVCEEGRLYGHIPLDSEQMAIVIGSSPSLLLASR